MAGDYQGAMDFSKTYGTSGTQNLALDNVMRGVDPNISNVVGSNVGGLATAGSAQGAYPSAGNNYGPQSGQLSSINTTASDNLNNQLTKNAAYDLQQKQDYGESWMGQADPYIKGGAAVAQGLGSLANIYLGFEQLGLAKDQAAMAKEQWAEQKKELAHVRGVRKRITDSY